MSPTEDFRLFGRAGSDSLARPSLYTEDNPLMRHYLVIALVALVAVAIASRVPMIKNLVYPNA